MTAQATVNYTDGEKEGFQFKESLDEGRKSGVFGEERDKDEWTNGERGITTISDRWALAGAAREAHVITLPRR